MIIPDFLKAGDKVAVVNPAKRLQSGLTDGLEKLKSWGLEPVLGEYVSGTHNLFSGTDEERLKDMQWALDDPGIKAIVMARGGYGTTRILDELDFETFLEKPKWVCGFSDITSLLCRLDNFSVASIHGPMVASFGRNDESDEQLRKILFGENLKYSLSTGQGNSQGECTGQVTGGNLTILCNSIGTSSEINTEGKILFLEEVGEYIYHLDRMLVHLKRAGKLTNLAGAIIGDFSSMKDHNDSFGLSTREVLRAHFDSLGCPVVYGFPAGHENRNLPLVYGKRLNLNVGNEEVNLNFNLSENQLTSRPG